MRISRRFQVVLVTLTLAACEVDDDDDAAEIAAICEGKTPVQLVTASAPRNFEIHPVRDGAMMVLKGVGELATYVGRGCGAKPVKVVDGAAMVPARIELDPGDDDPAHACLLPGGRLFELDLTGAAPPKLLLPHLLCYGTVPMRRGVLIREELHSVSALGSWYFPEFPSEAGAVRLAAAWFGSRVRGDTIYFVVRDELLTYDVTTRNTHLLVPGVDEFSLHDTHVLWRASTPEGPAPMHLLDLASATSVQIGVSDPALDDPPDGDAGRWDFIADGKYVLHVPGLADAPREAFDLRGERLAMPLPGRMVTSLPDGHVISWIEATGEMFAARPGDAAETRLDWTLPPDARPELEVVGDRVETVLAGGLHEVPLDGAAARLLVPDVGPARARLGDHHLVTVFEESLVSIDLRTGARTRHHEHVPHLRLAPDGRGVHYIVAGDPADPGNGLWYLPATALAP